MLPPAGCGIAVDCPLYASRFWSCVPVPFEAQYALTGAIILDVTFFAGIETHQYGENTAIRKAKC